MTRCHMPFVKIEVDKWDKLGEKVKVEDNVYYISGQNDVLKMLT